MNQNPGCLGYFCTVPPLFGRLCLPVACWVSNTHVPDEVMEAHRSCVKETISDFLDPALLLKELIKNSVVKPILIGYKDPYWLLDPVQVAYCVTALAYMHEHGWYDLKAEGFGDNVLQLMVPEPWILELPNGIVERQIRHGSIQDNWFANSRDQKICQSLFKPLFNLWHTQPVYLPQKHDLFMTRHLSPMK